MYVYNLYIHLTNVKMKLLCSKREKSFIFVEVSVFMYFKSFKHKSLKRIKKSSTFIFINTDLTKNTHFKLEYSSLP